MHWADRYIRIPFRDGGRNARGVDCWGMVSLVMWEQKGIDLPAYGEISAKDLARIALKMEAGAKEDDWLPVNRDDLREFDFVLMNWFGGSRIGHVGIMIDGKRVLHTEEVSGPVIVDLDHYSIRTRVRMYRRYRSLA